MPEKSDDIDWSALYERERFQVPSRELSPRVKRHFAWEGWSKKHKIPAAWLTHYARAFHFSDEEILAARTKGDMPIAGGIYFLFQGDKCVYVGQTKCFWDRSQQHQKNGLHWESHAYFEAPKRHAKAIEAYYIRRMRPCFNSSFPNEVTYSELVDKLGLDRPRVAASMAPAAPTTPERTPAPCRPAAVPRP